MVRQAAAGEALVGTLRLFRGGQRAWPRARRRGGRGLSRHELVERALPTPALEQSLQHLSEACTQLSALACWAGGPGTLKLWGKGRLSGTPF